MQGRVTVKIVCELYITYQIRQFSVKTTCGILLSSTSASKPMANSELFIEETEIFEDQIVPDQDDCFLPPSADIPTPWNVSI